MVQIETAYAGPRTWAGLTHRPTTFRQLMEAHLAFIRARLGQRHDLQALFDEVSEVLGDWAERPIGAGARRTSFVGNDGSPVEFSFAFSPDDGVRTRVLFEPGGATATRSELERHLLLLAARLGDGTRRLDAVADLFLGPAADPSPFLLLHAVEAGHATTPPLHKVYLNPMASGQPPLTVVREAMGRLGLGPAWERVQEHLGADRLGSPTHEPALFALDLVDQPAARVKVYLRHSRAGIGDIELVSRLGTGHREGRYAELLGALNPAPLAQWVKAPMTCLAFAADGTAPTTTLYCPLDPNLPNDAVAGARVAELLTRLGIGVEAFRSVAATASGARPEGSNRLSWVGFKEVGRPVVTVYVGLGGTADAEPNQATPAGADQEERVVLLDEQLRPIGSAPKRLAHGTDTPLHLAFSCYLFDDSGRVLVSRRAPTKLTWPGVWTNSFCGHPAPGESLLDAVRRRATQELGIKVDRIRPVLPDFRYRAVAVDGMVENEHCPVFVARSTTDPQPDPVEVCDWQWLPWNKLLTVWRAAPFLLSPWAQEQLRSLATIPVTELMPMGHPDPYSARR